MVDIAMCFGEGCPLRNSCYRFTAGDKDSLAQLYLSDSPYSSGECRCDFLWERT